MVVVVVVAAEAEVGVGGGGRNGMRVMMPLPCFLSLSFWLLATRKYKDNYYLLTSNILSF